MSNLNTSRWLSGMNCVGYTPQEAQIRKSHVVLDKGLKRDKLLKEGWMNKFDQCLAVEKHEQDHIDRRDDALMATHAFHTNRNSLHAWRHDNAVHDRNRTAKERETRFNNLAHKKFNQTEAFIDRRTRLLVEMAGEERAKREIALRDARAESMARCNASRKAKLPYCG